MGNKITQKSFGWGQNEFQWSFRNIHYTFYRNNFFKWKKISLKLTKFIIFACLMDYYISIHCAIRSILNNQNRRDIDHFRPNLIRLITKSEFLAIFCYSVLNQLFVIVFFLNYQLTLVLVLFRDYYSCFQYFYNDSNQINLGLVSDKKS